MHRRALVVWSCLLGTAVAQQDLQGRIDAASQQLEAGAAEAAATELRAVRVEIAALEPAAQRRWLTAVDALMAKADPDDAAAQKLVDAAARKVLEVAQAYQKRKWPRAALPWFARAATLSPKVARQAWLSAQTAAGLATAAAGDEMLAWFGEGTSCAGSGKWQIATGLAMSPPLGTDSEGWRSKRTTGPAYRLDVEVLVGDQPAKTSLVFGLKPRDLGDDYHLFELRHADGFSHLRLFHVRGVEIQELASKFVQLTRTERGSWLPVWVEVRGNGVAAGVSDFEQVECTATTPDVAGCLGLYVSGDSPKKEPVQWRGLRVRPL